MSTPSPIIQKIENNQMRAEPLPDFRVGDKVRVQVRIREGEKERLQAFEGVVIARSRGSNRATFTVRKISYSVGVERVFSENSPNVDSVEVLSRGKVNQATLYYLRGLSGKKARIKERAFDQAKADKKSGRSKKRGTHRKAKAVAEAVVSKTAAKAAPAPAPASAPAAEAPAADESNE